MPRKLIKRYFPDFGRFREDHKLHSVFGKRLHDPNLWHLNRHSVAGAFAVGLFCAFIPFPGQMIIAAAAAIVLRVNLPISVVVVWISNPLTVAPMFYAAYEVGEWVLGLEPGPFELELSLEWLTEEFSEVWLPLVIGCIILGSLSSLAGYILVRIYWRLHVMKRWGQRRLRRCARAAMAKGEKDVPG
ncbi:MAG: DUF2062 domain-containing protein [Pseudomonadota bacterium]|nr:DUF2062 domain-containing protein [Pseudomonadota bacterium]